MVPEGGGQISEPFQSAHAQAEIPELLFPEKAVLVLLQLLHQVDELLIVELQLPHLAADLVHPDQIRLLRPLDIRLQPVQFLLILFHQSQVPGDDKLQQIVQEPLQAGLPPALSPADPLQQLLRLAALIDEDHALFIQGEGKSAGLPGQIPPVRDQKSPGEGVIVHLGLGSVDILRIRLQLDAHIEGFPVLLPLLPGQHGGIRRFPAAQFRQGAGLQLFFQEIIHRPVLPFLLIWLC